MTKAATLADTARNDAAVMAALRFILVSGCATALIVARYPLPF